MSDVPAQSVRPLPPAPAVPSLSSATGADAAAHQRAGDLAGPPAPARHPMAELLALAVPTIAQTASYTLMQFVDAWMLSQVGDQVTAFTAASNSGMVSFTIISFGMGALFLVNTLVSQHYGQGDRRACGQYLWQGIWLSLLISAFSLPFLPLGDRIFALLGHESALIAPEAAYLRITLAFAVVKLSATSVGQFLLAVNRPSRVLMAAVIGVCANFVFALPLIFGFAGIPALGVVGAAWAQNIGVTVELGLLVAFAAAPEIRRTYFLADWRLRLRQLWTLLRVGVPSGVQVLCEVLAWTLFALWIVGDFGTRAMAANSFTFRVMSVSFMPAFGMSTAVTALVGRYIGMGRPDLAARRAHLAFALTALYMLTCGLLFYLTRHWLIAQFTPDVEVQRLAALLLVLAALYQLFDAMYIIYNGALRGAGDTFVPAIFMAIACWLIVVFGGRLLAVKAPGLGILGPWIAAMTYGVVLGLYILTRFIRGSWQAIHLDEPSATHRVPGFPVVLRAEAETL